jgi:lipoate-protein ligase A
MTWRFEECPPTTGAENMRRDQQLALDLLTGTGTPALRLYRWQPRAVSLGWHQSNSDIDEPEARRRGIDIVRRPTGGRAILHADELTYCVVCLSEGRSLSSVYGAVNAALLRAISRLGLRASLEDSMPDFRQHYRDASSAVCFSSTARNEVKVGGRKLIGSAQRRYVRGNGDEIVLQHGSILMGPGHEEIVDLLSGIPADRRAELRSHLLERTTTVAALTGGTVGIAEVAAAVRRGFEEVWNLTFEFADRSMAAETIS